MAPHAAEGASAGLAPQSPELGRSPSWDTEQRGSCLQPGAIPTGQGGGQPGAFILPSNRESRSEMDRGARRRRAKPWMEWNGTWKGRDRRGPGARWVGGQVRGACGANRGCPHLEPHPQTSLLLLCPDLWLLGTQLTSTLDVWAKCSFWGAAGILGLYLHNSIPVSSPGLLL